MHDDDYDGDQPFVVIEKTTTSMSSFLVGLALGAGVALLLAPRTGEETRRELRRSARRIREAAQGVADDVTQSVAGTFTEARQQVEERLDSARRAVELKKQQVSRAVEAGRAAAQQARDDLERRIAETKAAYDAGTPASGTRRGSGGSRAARAASRGE
jgi:gas vesicle protein